MGELLGCFKVKLQVYTNANEQGIKFQPEGT